MKYIYERYNKLKAYTHTIDSARNVNPMDIRIAPGYKIEIYATGLDSPVGLVFSDDGTLYIADSGIASGYPKVLRMSEGRIETIADNFIEPITGISYMEGNIYVSHKGHISVLRSNGTRQEIISGLPSNGDYGVSNVAFGPDGKIYFGIGTITNSGVVGTDNQWVFEHPLMHDVPSFNMVLRGLRFETDNMLITGQEKSYTGCFASYGTTNEPYETKKGVLKASGSILRANRDGTQLEPFAWGFRNPIRLKFDHEFQLIVANRGYDVRGSRPIANAPDELHYVIPGIWYGWPDYCAGEPVTLAKYRPEGGPQPEFLLAEHPNTPPRPFVLFPPHSSIMGFDINDSEEFGPVGDIYIAEFGSFGATTMGPSAPYIGIGHKISRIDVNTREISTFISNKSGLPALTLQDSGLGRLVDVTFGPDSAMYVLDSGISEPYYANQYLPNTGVIWKISREN
jgi:glucose/arabinose dehydrogenase